MPPEVAVAPLPGGVLRLALDPEAAPPADATSQRILDAALALVAEAGIRAVTMDAVAARAGAGRMTVDRRFGDRAGLIESLTIRETRGGLAEVAATQADQGLDAVGRIAEGFAVAIRIAREHPLFSRIPAHDVIAGFNAPRDQTAQMVRRFLAARIREGQAAGEMRAVDPDEAAHPE